LHESRYLSHRIDVTRFTRRLHKLADWRLHKLADWLEFIVTTLGEIGLSGEVFVIDSLPVPVCRRVRTRRCKKGAWTRILRLLRRQKGEVLRHPPLP
jgi:hypothetical protein